ncbi:MAG: TrmB family transcriptional regulator [Candidatus Zixiibacteriota bacterium]|nr:MAG: TrmB family transcriptional regulator [candidate division Zixibacteria bacterium]
MRNCEDILIQMGFSKYEAAAYIFLLQHSPATGYRVAKGIGTSYSNTYKILRSLEQRGYLLLEQGTRNRYRAIGIDELTEILQKNFLQHRDRLAEAFLDLPRVESDPSIYQLKTVDQVYARCEKMLGECQKRALLEIFPEPLERLMGTLEAASARGCQIVVRIYRPARIKGVTTVLSPYAEQNIVAWDSQWLAIYIDGLQYLQAVLANGGKAVLQGVWSENLLFSQAFFSYVNSDLHHYAFQSIMKSSSSLEEVRLSYEKLQKEFPVGTDMGYRALLANLKTAYPGTP